jgi:hypothetical protein
MELKFFVESTQKIRTSSERQQQKPAYSLHAQITQKKDFAVHDFAFSLNKLTDF